jgi:predicted ATPase/class 3 adenylate cyclase/DNA-binding SARP family transcriptional activator
MVRLELLGPLRVFDHRGQEVTPPGRREQAALVALATVSPTSLSVERLASELYHDRETTDPRNAVQAVISRLRRSLGRSAGCVETTVSGYRGVDLTFDVDDVEQLLQEARDASDPARAQAGLDEARRRWRGPTLDGLEGDLIDGERLRIDNLVADAEDHVLDRRLAAGGDADLIGALEAAVRRLPLRERRWELLMLALYRDGRQAEALRTFQRARAILSNQLGLEPGPGLSRLEQQILAQDPDLAHPSPAASPVSDRPRGHGTKAGQDPTDSGIDQSAASTPLPAGTITVLMCDVEGSVRRWEAAPTDTADHIADLHRVWAGAAAAHEGRVVKSTGDGIMAVFTTAHRALAAAAAAMASHEPGPLTVRAAAHSGPLEPVADDYRGPVVNRCARLLDVAHGGQILASATTADLARADLAAELDLRDLGFHWLRDVPDPLGVWQLVGPGVRSTFPPLRTHGPDSLPRLRANLLGRDELTATVAEHVGTAPLVTLIGPGGIGKTSTALATAWELVGIRPARFVDLARVIDPAAVADRIADDLGLTDHDDDREPVERISDRLRANTDLLVIDNAEHVLDAVADVVDAVLRYETKGSFLVTSRQPLALPGEVVVAVPPLALPTSDDDLGATGRSPSVQLFLSRVKAARPDVDVPDGLLPVVAHICRHLDGLPLAIELAASRASVLSIDDIAARLDDQLRLLRQLRGTRERRHQSLEAVVGWSIDLLSPGGRELFDRLSVMAGSFGLDGVEALTRHLGLTTVDPLDDLDELQQASLLVVEPGGSRYRLLEPIRQVAAAELAQRGLETETRQAHAWWMTDLVEDAHRRRDESRAESLGRIDRERAQLTAALAWMADSGQRDLASAIALPCAWWFLTRDPRTGERLLGRLLEMGDRDDDPVGWARLVAGVAIATSANPRPAVAEPVLDAVTVFDDHDLDNAGLVRVAAAIAQTHTTDTELPLRLLGEAERMVSSDDRWALAVVDMATMALQNMIMTLVPGAVDRSEAIARGERAAASFRQVGEDWALGVTLGELGRLHQRVGDLDAAELCFVEALELFRDRDYHGNHYLLSELGRIYSGRGEHDRALACHRRSLEIAEADGSPACMAGSLAGFAHAAEARGERDLAVGYYRQALDLVGDATIIEHGPHEWRQRIEALLTD